MHRPLRAATLRPWMPSGNSQTLIMRYCSNQSERDDAGHRHTPAAGNQGQQRDRQSGEQESDDNSPGQIGERRIEAPRASRHSANAPRNSGKALPHPGDQEVDRARFTRGIGRWWCLIPARHGCAGHVRFLLRCPHGCGLGSTVRDRELQSKYQRLLLGHDHSNNAVYSARSGACGGRSWVSHYPVGYNASDRCTCHTRIARLWQFGVRE